MGYEETSRRLAQELVPGEHRLYNSHLRQIYGMGRVTAASRTQVATELLQAGVEVLSDPRYEPLVLRKVDRRPVVAGARPWWQRGRVIAIAAGILFLLIVAAASGPGNDDEPNDGPRVTASDETTTTDEAPAETLADAQKAVDADDYATAMDIAAGLGEGEKNQIARRISRRIGRRVLRALAKGDRGKARRLLREAEAEDYPMTSALRRAQSDYDVAVAQARERAEAKRQARREARAQERAEERARREAEEAAQAPDPAPSDEGSAAPDESGPSTNNWCGKRDGDGDGIYCEGE